MRISQIYNLEKSQAELDFVDIDPEMDLPLFLDPFFLGKKQDHWSIEATATLRDFFQCLISLIRDGRIDEAKDLFDYLHEPNTTCLGMSTRNPQGRGVGHEDTDKIFSNLLQSRAIQTGLIQDIEDNVLFVDNFGKDKLSDMTTNIITSHLVEYTINQCTLHNIPLVSNISSGFFWDRRNNEWDEVHTDALLINGKRILLVPKGVVSFCKAYTPNRYYNHFVLNYLQNEHIRLRSALVQRRQNGTPYVTKKSIKERNPLSKDFLRRFTHEHPELLDRFKENTKIESLSNWEITEIDIRGVSQAIIQRLRQIPFGQANASAFHNLIIGALEMIFYPYLINPVKEREIHEGRKRIDITFDNAADGGIFYRLSEIFHLPCPYVFIECKNYTGDVANPELDQLAGRFSFNRGRVGFLVCRNIESYALFVNRCKDTYRDDRGLIVPLTDDDIICMLENLNEYNTNFIDDFLSNKVRDIVVG